MLLRYTGLLVSGCLFSHLAAAQEPAASFVQASVLLASGDTVRGALAYFPEKNLLVVRPAEGGMRAFPAAQVRLAAGQEKMLQLTPWAENIQSRSIQSPEYVVEPSIRSLRNVYDTKFYQKHYNLAASKRVDTTWANTFRIFRSLPWQEVRSAGQVLTATFFEQLTDGPVMLLQRPAGEVGAAMRYFLLGPDNQLMELSNAKVQISERLGSKSAKFQKIVHRQHLSFGEQADLPFIVALANIILTEQHL